MGVKHQIIWLTGQSGAGKTTLAKALQKELGGIILDGDEMRESVSLGAGFSPKDREEHNLRVSRLAKVLSKQTTVIVAVIAPFEKTRLEIDKQISPVWVYIKRPFRKSRDKPYEPPKQPELIVQPNKQSVKEQVKLVQKLLRDR